MKRVSKIIILSVVAILLSMAPASAQRISSQVNSLVNGFRGYEGVEVVHVGSFLMSILKSAARSAARQDGVTDPDMKTAISALSGVSGMTVVDYGDASDRVRDRLSAKLNRILEDAELLMEVKDEGESFRIYGSLDERTGKVRDIVMASPGDGTVICVKGTVDVDALASLASEQK